MSNKNGSKWCRPSTRLAIYLRDGLCCAYCQASLENGAQLTLDHVRPRERGGDNSCSNLVTACLSCNSARKSRAMATFAKGVSAYTGEKAETIIARIKMLQRRVPMRDMALQLIKSRQVPQRGIKFEVGAG